MSKIQGAPKTLFEIIDNVLLEFEDSNLNSNVARNKIADEICDRYYTEMETPIDEDYENANWGTHIANDGGFESEVD